MSQEEYFEPSDEGGALPDFLRDPIGMLRRRWRWMLLAFVVGLAATAGIVSLVKPRYEASSTILITSQRIPEHLVRPTVEEDSIAQINAMMGQVLTRETLARLITEQNLYPKLQESETLDGLVGRVREDLTIEPERGVTRASRNETSRLLRIQFRAESPATAAAVANQIADLFTEENIRSRSRQARLTTDFLRQELDAAETALRDQEGQITAFKERHRGELPGELATNIGRLERLQEQRSSLSTQIEETITRITLLSSNPEEATPDQRLMTMRAELEQQLAVRTERHPDVVNLRDQIAALERSIQANGGPNRPSANPVVSAEQRHLSQLRGQLRETETEIGALDRQVASTPKRQEELSALVGKADVLRENYLGFLRKVNEAELAQNLETAQYGARFSVLDRAVPPSSPVASRIQFLLAGLILSFGLAAGIGLLLELLDPVIVASSQLERVLQVPVLGTLPRLP